MDVKAIAISKNTYALLYANGQSDRHRGADMIKGWGEIADMCGYPKYERTPAREAYEDGYYGATRPKEV